MEHYKHESGLDFEFGYINNYDITVVLLYTGDDYAHDHVDPYLVGHWYGPAENMSEDDAKYVIDKWLKNKTEDDIKLMLNLQQAFDNDNASWNKP